MNTATPGQLNFTPVRAKTVRKGNTPAALQSRCTNTPNPTPKMMGRTPLSGQWTPTTCKIDKTGKGRVEVFVDRKQWDNDKVPRVPDIEMCFPPSSSDALRNVECCLDDDIPMFDQIDTCPEDVLQPPLIDDISFDESPVDDIEDIYPPVQSYLQPVSFDFNFATETPDLTRPGAFEQCSILQPILPI
eukprot:TRINITY_DN2518_c0_g1_i1.p1 TRINITY_DN2518_c0_g1~~TRINITY_DN2518_c0_g1_i1.p1  ORF type:complete len:203 (+),score=53.85 TRINITY_DN2518_c0_g1_i1:47-610(+)